MHNYLIEKLPLVCAWIEETLNHHTPNSCSVKDFVSIQKFHRLPHYFTDGFLSRAKVVLVEKVPKPPLSSMGLSMFESFEKADVAGTTYKDTYFIKRQNCFDESLHFHELVHVVQWDYLGIEKFLLAYALGLINHGYVNSPLEVMAYGLQQYFIQNPGLFAVEDIIRSELDTIMPSILDNAFKGKL
ncbi:hypothetical protein [Dissulfurispira sp.]|uniref:hypothetical protein n=1 Tax=Dissulfurispira sp. TaxID=2817609 RepID=UPI002FD8F9D4